MTPNDTCPFKSNIFIDYLFRLIYMRFHQMTNIKHKHIFNLQTDRSAAMTITQIRNSYFRKKTMEILINSKLNV